MVEIIEMSLCCHSIKNKGVFLELCKRLELQESQFAKKFVLFDLSQLKPCIVKIRVYNTILLSPLVLFVF